MKISTMNKRRRRRNELVGPIPPKHELREMLFSTSEEMMDYVTKSYEKVRQMFWDAAREKYVVRRLWKV